MLHTCQVELLQVIVSAHGGNAGFGLGETGDLLLEPYLSKTVLNHTSMLSPATQPGGVSGLKVVAVVGR